MESRELNLRDGIRIEHSLEDMEGTQTVTFSGTTENDGAVFSYRAWLDALQGLHRSERSLPFDLERCLPGGQLDTTEARELAQAFARQSFELAIKGPRGEMWMTLAGFCWRGGFRILSAEPAGGAPNKEIYLVRDGTLSGPRWREGELEETSDRDGGPLLGFFEVDGMSLQGELVTGRHLLLIGPHLPLDFFEEVAAKAGE